VCDPGRVVYGVGGVRSGSEARVNSTFDQFLEPRSLLPRRRIAIYCPSISPLPDREPFPKASSSREQ
jgi:hypothetical protein